MDNHYNGFGGHGCCGGGGPGCFGQNQTTINSFAQPESESESEAAVEVTIDSDVLHKMEDWFSVPEPQLMQIIRQECHLDQ